MKFRVENVYRWVFPRAGEIPQGESEASGGAELLNLGLLNNLTHF